MPIVNTSWRPFRVCSNDHAPLTGMPYILFFKIKNCLNNNLFISCDDRKNVAQHLLICSGYVTQVSDPWPVGLLFFLCFRTTEIGDGWLKLYLLAANHLYLVDKEYFFIIPMYMYYGKTNVVCSNKNSLGRAILMNTNDICLYRAK